MRNVFTVGVKRSVVPALFPEIEMRSQKLYDQDVGKASGLNVVYDITYVFYSSTRPCRVYAVFHDGLDQTFQSGRQLLGPLVRSAGAFPHTGYTRVDGLCQGPLEP